MLPERDVTVSSSNIAQQINQCDSSISESEKKIDNYRKEIEELNILKNRRQLVLNNMEFEYDERTKRMNNLEYPSDRVKTARTYLTGMTETAKIFRDKLTSLNDVVDTIETEIKNKESLLQNEEIYLANLRNERNGLQTSYNQAIWDEEQEKIKHQQEWDAQQNKANSNKNK